jgi:cytochrome c oxidase subunit 1
MPRRIYTYEPGRGWDTLNLIITIGAFIQAIAILVFIANLIISYFKGAEAGNDPWDAWTLEWSTSSPRRRTTLRPFQQLRAAVRCGT